MRRLALALALALASWFSPAFADPSPSPAPGPPYRLWWSLPLDDDSAIEVDEVELKSTKFGNRWQLALMQGCAASLPRKSIIVGGGPVTRELKVETLDAAGQAHGNRRCVRTLADWKRRLGARLIERLEDELDAHIAFLHPRHVPN